MGDENQNAIEIAVLKEQILGIREQQRAHNSSTQERFDDMGRKLDALFAALNRGKGAYAASIIFAGAIGALLLSLITWAAGIFHK